MAIKKTIGMLLLIQCSLLMASGPDLSPTTKKKYEQLKQKIETSIKNHTEKAAREWLALCKDDTPRREVIEALKLEYPGLFAAIHSELEKGPTRQNTILKEMFDQASRPASTAKKSSLSQPTKIVLFSILAIGAAFLTVGLLLLNSDHKRKSTRHPVKA